MRLKAFLRADKHRGSGAYHSLARNSLLYRGHILIDTTLSHQPISALFCITDFANGNNYTPLNPLGYRFFSIEIVAV